MRASLRLTFAKLAPPGAGTRILSGGQTRCTAPSGRDSPSRQEADKRRAQPQRLWMCAGDDPAPPDPPDEASQSLCTRDTGDALRPARGVGPGGRVVGVGRPASRRSAHPPRPGSVQTDLRCTDNPLVPRPPIRPQGRRLLQKPPHRGWRPHRGSWGPRLREASRRGPGGPSSGGRASIDAPIDRGCSCVGALAHPGSLYPPSADELARMRWVRPLCQTPCTVVSLRGPHTLQHVNVDPSTRQESWGQIHTTATPDLDLSVAHRPQAEAWGYPG